MFPTDRFTIRVTDKEGKVLRHHARLKPLEALDLLETVISALLKRDTQFAFTQEEEGDRVLSIKGGSTVYRMIKL